MIAIRWAALALSVLALGASRARAETLDEALYAELLQRHTREVADTAGTRVDYPAIARSADWKRLIAGLSQVDPGALRSREEKLAFWINAYNILAIDVVARNYPLESIRDVGSIFSPVWDREAGRIDGKPYTLGQIEHEILRPLGDPRIHVAIVCASTSCPSLRREPFSAARVGDQLDDSSRRFLASGSKGLAVDRRKGTVRVSKIFDWFEEDFEDQGGVLAWVTRYAPAEERRWLEQHRGASVRYFDYDWSVNVVRG